MSGVQQRSSCGPSGGFGGPVGEGAGAGAGGVANPSLVPREVKLSKPSTFAGKKAEVDNFIFEMR